MLVEDHGVSIKVQLLEGGARVVLPLNVLNNPVTTSVLQYFSVRQT